MQPRLTLLAAWGLTLASATPLAHADFIGIFIGAGVWDHAPSGTTQYQGDELDVEQDLGLGGDTQSFGWLAVEHPLPLLPNLRLGLTRARNAGDALVTTSFTFGGQTFTVSEQIASVVELDQQDATFYYEVLDNVVSLDLGIDVKRIKGTAEVTSRTTGITEATSFDAWIPMLYGRADLALPLTGLSVGVEGAGIGYSGSSLTDLTARVAYETDTFPALGLELGYRRQNLTLDDVDGVSTDIDLDGPFAAMYFHF